jgi:hypothetical protein
MDELKNTGRYTVSEDVKRQLDHDFTGGYCDEEKTAEELMDIVGEQVFDRSVDAIV